MSACPQEIGYDTRVKHLSHHESDIDSRVSFASQRLIWCLSTQDAQGNNMTSIDWRVQKYPSFGGENS